MDIHVIFKILFAIKRLWTHAARIHLLGIVHVTVSHVSLHVAREMKHFVALYTFDGRGRVLENMEGEGRLLADKGLRELA